MKDDDVLDSVVLLVNMLVLELELMLVLVLVLEDVTFELVPVIEDVALLVLEPLLVFDDDVVLVLKDERLVLVLEVLTLEVVVLAELVIEVEVLTVEELKLVLVVVLKITLELVLLVLVLKITLVLVLLVLVLVLVLKVCPPTIPATIHPTNIIFIIPPFAIVIICIFGYC